MSSPRTGEASGLLLLLAPGLFLVLWSLAFPVSKLAIAYVDPMLLLVLRYVLVLVVLLPLLLFLSPAWPTTPAQWGHQAVVGVLIQTVYFGLCYTAFGLGASAGTVALVVCLQPVVVAVASPWLVGERQGTRSWCGLMLGLAGAVIVIWSKNDLSSSSLWAILCAIGALAGMSGATLYEKRFGVAQHPVVSNTIQYGVGLITALPLALAFGHLKFQANAVSLGALAYLVLGSSLIAVSLLLMMVRRGEAARVSSLFYLVPPVAALMAWWMLDEPMPSLAWVGMAVAACGVALVRPPRKAMARRA